MKGVQFSDRPGRLRLIANVVSGLVLLAILLMVMSFAYVAYYANFDEEYVERTEAIRVLAQSIAKNASEAANGKTDAFFQLRDARRDLEQNMNILVQGNPETSLPPTADFDETAGAALERLGRPWEELRRDADTILELEREIIGINVVTEQFRREVPQLQRLLDSAGSQLASAGANPGQVYLSGQGLLQAERIGRNLGEMVRGGIGNITAAGRLDRSADELRGVLDSLLGNGPFNVPAVTDGNARADLEQASGLFGQMEERIANVIDSASDVYRVRDAADRVFVLSDRLDATSVSLLGVYRGLPEQRPVQWWFGFLFGALALVLLVVRAALTRVISGRELEKQKAEKLKADETSKKNQQAILDLLDEIQGLSEGDLTVQASVGEEFTGAIGDAFNDSIDALRNLVTTINETSVQVSSAAQQTQATAMHLAEASDHQAHQITAASAAINEMAVSIDQVSRNSEESADVARRSVDLAHKGADTVRRTIDGMDTIREQIQETSKRIKRLGESSQEIGNIVELINDIADQTNILALNASIQAAMAGEAGRGFAVVADEVQRLAERSGNATKQIEALVKTIQTDTNEAVISMEQSTAGVVSGARLAEDAGDALREIETTSQQLAGLIESISEAARQQAKAAGNISDTMNVIQEITSQTSAGTNETATSIGNLADLANDLRNSVAGFKLPE
ncbi:MAG: type IV pili methyl-accepting chemotaxis transducer N-terminal domain-containing protein [Ectothiorhodospiraceae bacterium]|nr:type IV pili methyl-accepting chemotaxis transducer N-terminal domain-containing protein [Ectothiorhodospiraceae bacterium]MCH8502742.1 methyl-accepting chemotaxis protein [Ectothiorhodospiraceae bacterium]